MALPTLWRSRGPRAHPVEVPWPPCPVGSVAALGLVAPEDSVSRRKRSAEGLKAPITHQLGTWRVWAPPASASCERGGGPFRGGGWGGRANRKPARAPQSPSPSGSSGF